MPISLSKGQKVDLTKKNPGLKKNIVEHWNDLQNWHQGIECHSGCNETHTLPTY